MAKKYPKVQVCPYCGNGKTSFYIGNDIEFTTAVYCRKCCARGPLRHTPEDAIKEWNEVSVVMQRHWE